MRSAEIIDDLETALQQYSKIAARLASRLDSQPD